MQSVNMNINVSDDTNISEHWVTKLQIKKLAANKIIGKGVIIKLAHDCSVSAFIKSYDLNFRLFGGNSRMHFAQT